MAKKTKNQVYDAWLRRQSERHRRHQEDPHYQKIIQDISSIREQRSKAMNQHKDILSHIPKGVPIPLSHPCIKELKAVDVQINTLSQAKASLERELIDKYGPIDLVLEDASDEELMLFTDFEDLDVMPFQDIWVVKPVLFGSKDALPRVSEGLNKINWDAYLDDRKHIRFQIRTENPREVIQERLSALLDILKGSKIITFKRKKHPFVKVVGLLNPDEGKGAIIELNPFAPKKETSRKVIQVLRNYGFVFSRKDSYDPQRVQARKLRGKSKSYSQIARELYPREFKNKERKITRKKNLYGEERKQFYDYITALQEKGKSLAEAFKKAEKRFRLKGKKRINPLTVKAYRLVNQSR